MRNPTAKSGITMALSDKKQVGRVALKGFFGITADWGISSEQKRLLLGDIPEATFYKYQKLPELTLSKDMITRISYVMGIHKALRIIFPTKKRACAWLKKENHAEPFGGKTAVEFMAQGDMSTLFRVRQYLDAWRGGI